MALDSSGNLLIGRTSWVDNHFDNGIYLAGGTQAGMKFMRTASGSAGTWDIGIDTDRHFKFVYAGDGGGTGAERLILNQYATLTLESGSQGANSKPGIELKSTGYTGNITRLFQDSPNASSILETTERSLVIDIDSGNQVNGTFLQIDIDNSEQFRFDPSSITYQKQNTRGITMITCCKPRRRRGVRARCSRIPSSDSRHWASGCLSRMPKYGRRRC